MLKTKTITTHKATLLVVELPEGITEVTNTGKRLAIPDRKGGHHFFKGNWQLLGRLPEITEDHSDKVVEKYVLGRDTGYRDYGNTKEAYPFKLSISSLSSLLQANDILFDAGNTYIPHELGSMSATEHLERTLDVLDIKSKVWDKERTYLFIKVD